MYERWQFVHDIKKLPGFRFKWWMRGGGREGSGRGRLVRLPPTTPPPCLCRICRVVGVTHRLGQEYNTALWIVSWFVLKKKKKEKKKQVVSAQTCLSRVMPLEFSNFLILNCRRVSAITRSLKWKMAHRGSLSGIVRNSGSRTLINHEC